MSGERDILITGIGVVSALGLDAPSNHQALLHGATGIAPVRFVDTAHRGLPVGEVNLVTGHALRTVELGALALAEAVRSASLTDADLSDAVFVNGTTVAGMDNTERHFERMLDGAGRECGDMLAMNVCEVTTRLTAERAGSWGAMTTVSTACSSAANAIIYGARLIKAGLADIVVAGGAEALSRFHINGFDSLMILDREVCRPFDTSRAGINLGEGAGYLVLESRESAERRGAMPLASLAGWGNACDAYHQTATSPDGRGALAAMRRAIEMAHISPADVAYVNTHGTGTHDNDSAELAAMRALFGEKLPPYASTKSLTGHTTSASAGIEGAFCVLALQNGQMYAGLPTVNAADPNNPPLNRVEELTGEYVLCNSFGFGGNDSSLLFKKI